MHKPQPQIRWLKHMLKAVGLADQNMFLLMTTDNSALVNAEARKYVQLRRVQELRKLKLRMAAEEGVEADLQLEGNMTRKRVVGVQGLGSEADLRAEDTEERSSEEGAVDLLQQRQWARGFGSIRQNHGVFHHDFSSQIKRAQNRE